MRLNRFLSAAGIASRRKCEEIVRSGRVALNGVMTTNPFSLVEGGDEVRLDGKPISLHQEKLVILMNKPKGVITSVKDTHNRKTVMDLVNVDERLFPVGRLDKNTTGVLLLTNNGDLAHRLTHPRFGVEKTYRITLDRPLMDSDRKKIEAGVSIGEGDVGKGVVISAKIDGSNDQKYAPKSHIVRLRLTHGKKREVRRLVCALGYKLLDLHRESFAGMDAKGLRIGQWRKLAPNEVRRLMRSEHVDDGQ